MSYSDYKKLVEGLDVSYHVLLHLRSERAFNRYCLKKVQCCPLFTPIYITGIYGS